MSERFPAYLTVAQAAEALQLSPDTVRRLIAAGDLKAFRIGPRGRRRPIRVDGASLAALLDPVTELADLKAGDAA